MSAHRTVIDLDAWERRDHFRFFTRGALPAVGSMTVPLDVTRAKRRAEETGISFFALYLHLSLRTANTVENYRYRQENGEIILYHRVGAAFTVLRDDRSFGFASAPYSDSLDEFAQNVAAAIERCKRERGLPHGSSPPDYLHYTVVRNIPFTSLQFSASDNYDIPKFAFGALTAQADRLTMPHAVQSWHAFVDGYHTGLYFETFQKLLNEC